MWVAGEPREMPRAEDGARKTRLRDVGGRTGGRLVGRMTWGSEASRNRKQGWGGVGLGWVRWGGRQQQRERGVRRSGGRAACGLCAMQNASGPGRERD